MRLPIKNLSSIVLALCMMAVVVALYSLDHLWLQVGFIGSLLSLGWLIQYLHGSVHFKELTNAIVGGLVSFSAGELYEDVIGNNFWGEGAFALVLILVYFYVPRMYAWLKT